MPSVIGSPSFRPRTTIASCGAQALCPTNSPDFVSSRLSSVKRRCGHQCLFWTTPGTSPLLLCFPTSTKYISYCLLLYVSRFLLGCSRIVGVALAVLDMLLANYWNKKYGRLDVDFGPASRPVYGGAKKDDHGIGRSSRCESGLGCSMRFAGAIHGKPLR